MFPLSRLKQLVRSQLLLLIGAAFLLVASVSIYKHQRHEGKTLLYWGKELTSGDPLRRKRAEEVLLRVGPKAVPFYLKCLKAENKGGQGRLAVFLARFLPFQFESVSETHQVGLEGLKLLGREARSAVAVLQKEATNSPRSGSFRFIEGLAYVAPEQILTTLDELHPAHLLRRTHWNNASTPGFGQLTQAMLRGEARIPSLQAADRYLDSRSLSARHLAAVLLRHHTNHSSNRTQKITEAVLSPGEDPQVRSALITALAATKQDGNLLELLRTNLPPDPDPVILRYLQEKSPETFGRLLLDRLYESKWSVLLHTRTPLPSDLRTALGQLQECGTFVGVLVSGALTNEICSELQRSEFLVAVVDPKTLPEADTQPFIMMNWLEMYVGEGWFLPGNIGQAWKRTTPLGEAWQKFTIPLFSGPGRSVSGVSP